MRITKTIATEVATKMLHPKFENIEKLMVKRKEVFTEAHLKTLPQEVRTTFEKFPQWFERSKSCRIKNSGFGWGYYYFTRSLPSVEGWTEIDSETAKEITKLDNRITDEREKYHKLQSDLESALFSLRTYKNVTEKLPEAVPHLPKIGDTVGLMVDLNKLRKQITS